MMACMPKKIEMEPREYLSNERRNWYSWKRPEKTKVTITAAALGTLALSSGLKTHPFSVVVTGGGEEESGVADERVSV